MEEIWKDVEGYEGSYQVSNIGNVKNRHDKILKPYYHKRGYYIVTLWKHSKKKNIPIHRLVAMAFVPNKDNFSTVIHIDKDYRNNCYTNLMWIHQEELYWKGEEIIYGGKYYKSIRKLYFDLCEKTQVNIPYLIFKWRIKHWTNIEEILTIPVGVFHGGHKTYKLYKHKGKNKTLGQLYKITRNIKYRTFQSRLNLYNWSVDEAIEIPVRKKGNENV